MAIRATALTQQVNALGQVVEQMNGSIVDSPTWISSVVVGKHSL